MMSSKRLALSCGLFALCSVVHSVSAQQQEWVSTNQISFSDAYLCEHRLLVMPTSVPPSGDATIRKINLSVHNGARELRAPISTNEANEMMKYARFDPASPRPAYGEIFVRERSVPGLAPGSSPGIEVGYRWATETRTVTAKPNYVFGLEKKCPTSGTNGTTGGGAIVTGGAELKESLGSFELRGSFDVPSSWFANPSGRVVVLSPLDAWGASARRGETVGGLSVPSEPGKPVTISQSVQCDFSPGPFRCQPRTLIVAFLTKQLRFVGGVPGVGPVVEEDVVLASGVFEASPPLFEFAGGITGSGRFFAGFPLARAKAEVAFSFDYDLGGENKAQLFIGALPGPIAVQCHLSKSGSSRVINSTCSGGAGASFVVQDGSGTLAFEYDCDSDPMSSKSCDIAPEVTITLQSLYPDIKPRSTKIRLERAR